jgi:hypothetical protein
MLTGRWSCSGQRAQIKGATDDTLVRFQLKDPMSKTVQDLDHPVSGNLQVRVMAPGTYTMIFSNSGLIRSSARIVEIDVIYTPE